MEIFKIAQIIGLQVTTQVPYWTNNLPMFTHGDNNIININYKIRRIMCIENRKVSSALVHPKFLNNLV